MMAQTQKLNEMDDSRIAKIRPLIPPQILMEDLPLTPAANQTVKKARFMADQIISQKDDRLLVIVGPCSIHDVKAGLEYASKLKKLETELEQDLLIIMRVYFEKPRTTVGWKGLINDPKMDGTFAINTGLRTGRQLLLNINEMGLPAGVEFLDTISPQYLGDLVSWGAIGARTTESQIHRELASGLSCAVGFKNGTDGNTKVAIDAIKSSSSPHCFLSVTKQGLAAIVETSGNNSCHLILRGGKEPNYHQKDVEASAQALKRAGLTPSIMVDCSHGNSSKQHSRQIIVADDICQQLVSTESGACIVGVMVESNLIEGRQDLDGELEYGKSVTDACIGWNDTEALLRTLAVAVQKRRAKQF